MKEGFEQYYSLWKLLPLEEQSFLSWVEHTYHPTFQQMRLLTVQAVDLTMWEEEPLSVRFDAHVGEKFSGKRRIQAIIDDIAQQIALLRSLETDYSTFVPPRIASRKTRRLADDEDEELLGLCPVASARTRCCNLLTLDAVRQCAFACSYCSIQGFYHQNEVRFARNFASRLENLQLPENAWHIGTGQASDSLCWGNEQGILSAIADFARSHPHIVVEMKTKSSRTDWIQDIACSRNVIATWSLNAPTIIAAEEQLSASLDKRIEAARRASDAKILVGFHFHPLVRFAGWQQEYADIVNRLVRLFSPEEVVMISFGTLTFTKQVLKQMRESGRHSKITQMELVPSAGKLSYPMEVKLELFQYLYTCFPDHWKTADGPFFYLCMESAHLWEPALGRTYDDNASFEEDMRNHYTAKIVDKVISKPDNEHKNPSCNL